MHDIVYGVVCRGVLCVVFVVVCGVVDGCIMCMVFLGVLYWVLCLILCVVDYSLACALQRMFFLCLFVRGFS